MLMLYLSMADEPEEKRKIEKLYDEYNDLMRYIAHGILHRREDAEDAVISSWEKIILHLDQINEISCKKTKNFIVTIVKRTSIDLYRAKKRMREVPIEDYEEHPSFARRDAKLEASELTLWLDSLPAIYREALILFYLYGMSYEQIAEIQEVSANTVASRIRRGREMLREREKA